MVKKNFISYDSRTVKTGYSKFKIRKYNEKSKKFKDNSLLIHYVNKYNYLSWLYNKIEVENKELKKIIEEQNKIIESFDGKNTQKTIKLPETIKEEELKIEYSIENSLSFDKFNDDDYFWLK